MEVSFQADKITEFIIYNIVFYFRWMCWWGVGELLVNSKNYQGCQFDAYFIQCKTFTDIAGIVNEFFPKCPELFPTCIHTHLTHNWC